MKKLSTLCVLVAAIISCSLHAQELQNTSWKTSIIQANHQPQMLVHFNVDTMHIYSGPDFDQYERFLYGIQNDIFWVSDINGNCPCKGRYTLAIENDILNLTTIQDGCKSREAKMTTSTFVRETLSLPDNSTLTNLVMYPNPASNLLILKREQSGLIEIKIFDQTGRVVIETQSESEQIPIELDAISSGIYNVLLRDGTATMTKKLLVISD